MTSSNHKHAPPADREPRTSVAADVDAAPRPVAVAAGRHAPAASATGRRRSLVLAVLCTAQFVAVLDVNALIVALPLIGRDLHLAGGALQWVVTGYVVVYAGCLLAAGRIADAFGRKRIFLAGLATFTAASLACAVAPDSTTLIGARGLQGLGAAMFAPAALALLPKDGVAVWTATAAVGGASGLMVGGVLAGSLGWRWVFLINVPIGLATLALAPCVLGGAPRRASAAGTGDGHAARDAAGTNNGALERAPVARTNHAPGSARKPLDLRGAALSTLGLAALVYALAEHRWLLVIPAFVPLAFVLKRPKRPAVAGAFLTAALLTAATSGGGVLATLELQTHLGPFAAGLHLLPLSLSVITGSLIAGRRRIPISAGLALVALGSALAPLSLTAWAVLAGLGLGCASVAATALGMDGAEDPGGTAGLLGTAAQVGTAVGVATLVGVPGSGYAVAAAVTAVGAGFALWRPRAVARRLGSAPR